MKIAVLEDDPIQAQLTHLILQEGGHHCTGFNTGSSLLNDLTANSYDLLLLDWSLPDMTGYHVLGWVRAHLPASVFVVFLSNHDLEENIVASLMAGGDDYLVKPTRSAELLARIHAMERRGVSPQALAPVTVVAKDERIEEFGPYRLDKILKIAKLNGQAIDLKPKEFEIALLLLQQAGSIVSRETLMDYAWGRELLMTSRTLDTHISQMRRKMMLVPENGVKLSTIYALGYRLDLL